WGATPIGRTDGSWRADSARVVDTPLLDFVLEVERRAAHADPAAAAAVSADASIDSGAITAARMQALYPYDNTLRAIRISGRQLRDYLEFSARYYVTDANGTVAVDPKVPGYNFDIVAGADYVLDLSRPQGQRVTRLEVRVRPVALEPGTDSRGVRRGGAAYLAPAIRRARAECVAPECVSLLVDAGDQFQGTLASNLAFGRPVVRLFNQLGYVAAALGNHEFDWGQDTMRARMRDAHYPFLGANVRYADGRDVPWIRDDTLIVREGLKVGVIGLASVLTARTTAARNVTGLVFLPPGPIVDSLARRLRARGADYVIVLDHDGAFCDRTGAAACRGGIVGIAQSI